MSSEPGILELSTQPSRFLQVHRNTVKYTGKASHSNDIGAVRSTQPFPSGEFISYFEVVLEDAGAAKPGIGIGLSTGDFPLSKHPGYEANSYGYIGDDGKKYHDRGRGADYGPLIGIGDCVGCGLHTGSQDVFFTHNGKLLGAAFQRVPYLQYYPTISLHAYGEKVSVNFGATPFRFDLASYIEEEKKKLLQVVLNTPLDVTCVTTLIQEYLLHSGFDQTYRAFSQNLPRESSPTTQQHLSTLSFRKKLRSLVLAGDISGAVAEIRQSYPSLLDPADEQAGKLLYICSCQQFVELIKSGNPDQALEFMQSSLAHFFHHPETFDQTLLQDVVALLAYENPRKSPLKYLLTDSQRILVADALNHAVLNCDQMEKVGEATKLEMLLRQMILARGLSTNDAYLLEKDQKLELEVDDLRSVLFHTDKESKAKQQEDKVMSD